MSLEKAGCFVLNTRVIAFTLQITKRKLYACSKCFGYFEKESNFYEHFEEDCLSDCDGG